MSNFNQSISASGYTQVGVWTNGSGARVTLLRRTATGGESSVSVAYTPKTSVHSLAVEVAVYRGVDPNNPIDGTPTAGYASNSASVTAPSLTTSNAGDQLLMLHGVAGNALAVTWTPPTGMNEVIQSSTALIVGGIADQNLPTAGATGPRAASDGSAGSTTTLIGVLVALKAPPIPVLYFHQDQLGSTRVLTDVNGNKAASYTYDAWGNIPSGGKTGTAATPIEFAGQYTDPETGFQYLRARYYDPTTGLFLTRDPLLRLTQQPYSYSGDDPINASDPTGLFCFFGYNPDGSCRGHDVGSRASEVVGQVAGAVSTVFSVVKGCVIGGIVGGIGGSTLPTPPGIGTALGAVGGCIFGAGVQYLAPPGSPDIQPPPGVPIPPIFGTILDPFKMSC